MAEAAWRRRSGSGSAVEALSAKAAAAWRRLSGGGSLAAATGWRRQLGGGAVAAAAVVVEGIWTMVLEAANSGGGDVGGTDNNQL